MIDNISFIGLGKLGLPLACCFAKNGVKVTGVDLNENLISSLISGATPFHEPNLTDLLDAAKENITYQTTLKDVEKTDVTVILVNTPNDPKTSAFSNHQILSALESLCDHLLKTGKEKHDFVLSSTVLPGTIRDIIVPLIEGRMGWTLNKEFRFAYVPDFVALGTVIRDFEQPNLMVLGESDKTFGDDVLELYDRIITNGQVTHRMNTSEAELTKITFNAFLLSKVSFVNFIGNVCEKFGDANVDVITNAVASDKRISHETKMFFKAGLSWGGACWTRDVWAFQEMCRKINLNPHHIWAAEKINKDQDQIMIDRIRATGKKKIGFFGVAFKPDTHLTLHSVAEKITGELVQAGYEIHCHDFVDGAISEFYGKFGNDVRYHKDVKECLKKVDVAVILTPCKEYKEILNMRDGQTIIDGWRMLEVDDDPTVIQPGKIKL